MMAGFAGVVHFGHEVVDLLLRDAHGLHVQRGAVDDGAGGAGGLDGHVEHGVQVGDDINCGEELRGRDRTGDAGGDNGCIFP
jgi:hypothetical protein